MCQTDAPRHLPITSLPSIFALEDAFRTTLPDKATGFDPLPSHLFRQAACPLAAAYSDLLLKEFVWQSEPMQYKGGPVAIIPKCLAPTTANQFRGILLLGNMAKRTHSVLRKRILIHLEHELLAKSEVSRGSKCSLGPKPFGYSGI